MPNEETTQDEQRRAEAALNSAFSPHSPINAASLFRGRIEQIRDVVDAMTASGLHAVIYGDRGVGKTSLANIVHEFAGGVVSVSKTICGQGDNFSSVIRRAAGSIQLRLPDRQAGFVADEGHQDIDMLALLPSPESGPLVPDEVASLLARIPLMLVFVIDEFDRLAPSETDAFADLIKASSDRGVPATFVLVGVAENIDALLRSHASVVRNLRQIHLPRMSDIELGQIIDEGLAQANFEIDPTARKRIISVSQGFPHFTHLLTQSAARAALDHGRAQIGTDDVAAGITRAVDRSDQSIREAYHKAATAVRKNSHWREAIVACALAESDERGYFSTRTVAEQYGQLRKHEIRQQEVAYYLGKLTQRDRGPLLERTGPIRRYRYRFVHPLMRPYVLMLATRDGIISP